MNHPKMKYVYVGIDSHKETHCAAIINCFFEKLGEITFDNIPSGFENFLSDVKKFKLKGTSLAFGLEDTSAYGRALTVFLKSKNLIVKHTNAELVANERKSRGTFHKTDSEDAECAARVLLSRFDTLQDANPDDKYWVLQNLVARRKLIVRINVALKNHVQSFVLSHYPSYSKFFSEFDGKASLAFYEKYPSPSMLQGVTAEQLAAYFKEVSNKINWKDKAEKILHYVKKDGEMKIGYQEMRNLSIQSTIRQIYANQKELDEIDMLLNDFLQNFDYKLTSMNGIDIVMASYIIAEIGDIARFSTPAKLSKYAGIAPITYASGKTDVQYANERGNRTLATLFYNLAILVTRTVGKNQKMINPFFYDYYNRKLSEGKTKRQALKCVQRRLVNILFSMMKNQTEYLNPPMIDLAAKNETENQNEV